MHLHRKVEVVGGQLFYIGEGGDGYTLDDSPDKAGLANELRLRDRSRTFDMGETGSQITLVHPLAVGASKYFHSVVGILISI